MRHKEQHVDSILNSEEASPPKPRFSSSLAAMALALVGFLYVAWTGAWIIERALEPHALWMTTREGRVAYWLVARLLLWVPPAVVLIRASGRSFRLVMGLGRTRQILVWGGGTGLMLGAITVAVKVMGHQPLFASPPGLPFLSGVFIAPVVEEIVFRGAVLGALNARWRFGAANTVTALLFLGAHFPGWFFQGCLLENLKDPVGGALSIFLLGWLFGYVTHKSRSVAAGTVSHVLNNLFNS